MDDSSLRLGLLADTSSQLGKLVSVLRQSSHKIVCTALTKTHSLPLRSDVDAWVVRIGEHCERADELFQWLNDHDIPMVIEDVGDQRFGDNNHSAQWFSQKIRACVSDHNRSTQRGKAPEYVWVLAASTGGPKAVSDFVAELDTNAHKCAFIYAQHIDENALPSLVQTLEQRTSLLVRHCVNGAVIEAGGIYIVSPKNVFQITDSRRIELTGREWNGPYQPSINQVIAKVATSFRERSGVIVFTGMGNDGAGTARIMKALGGKVFNQSFASCTVDSMPREVDATGCVSFTGDIPELSAKINELCRLKQTKIGA